MHFWGIFCFILRVERGVTLGNCNLSIQPTFFEILSSWLSIASSLLHLSLRLFAPHLLASPRTRLTTKAAQCGVWLVESFAEGAETLSVSPEWCRLTEQSVLSARSWQKPSVVALCSPAPELLCECQNSSHRRRALREDGTRRRRQPLLICGTKFGAPGRRF